MNDYMYYVETGDRKFYANSFVDALDYYESFDGNKIVAQTRTLFPDSHVIVDQPHVDIERIRKDFTLKKTTKAERKAISKYDEQNCKQYKIKLNKGTDEDIIEYLDTLENKQGFIKELVREHMKKQMS